MPKLKRQGNPRVALDHKLFTTKAQSKHDSSFSLRAITLKYYLACGSVFRLKGALLSAFTKA